MKHCDNTFLNIFHLFFHFFFIITDMSKYDSHDNQNGCIEPYTINKTNQMSTSPTSMPKYLEIIYDDSDDKPVISSPYEIPLTGPIEEHVNNATDVQNIHDHLQTSLDLSNLRLENNQNNNNIAKERTFSSSSTVSETSVGYPPYTGKQQQQQQPSSTSSIANNSITGNTAADIGTNANNDEINEIGVLTVALANSTDECNSDDNLLTEETCQTSTDLKHDKIRQFYSIARAIDDMSSNCDDGITLM